VCGRAISLKKAWPGNAAGRAGPAYTSRISRRRGTCRTDVRSQISTATSDPGHANRYFVPVTRPTTVSALSREVRIVSGSAFLFPIREPRGGFDLGLAKIFVGEGQAGGKRGGFGARAISIGASGG